MSVNDCFKVSLHPIALFEYSVPRRSNLMMQEYTSYDGPGGSSYDS